MPSQPTIKKATRMGGLIVGWDGRIRTYEYQSQSLVPYRLATSQYLIRPILYHFRKVLSRVNFKKIIEIFGRPKAARLKALLCAYQAAKRVHIQ